MKKRLSIALTILLCLSLCACGKDKAAAGNSAQAKKVVEVVGNWTANNGRSDVYICLDEDYTGSMESEGIAFTFTWSYSQSTHEVTINFEAVRSPGKLTYHPEEDTLVFLDGTILSRVS